jgi:hypothetical protein
VRAATFLFYAAVTLFLGLACIAVGGGTVIAVALGGDAVGPEPQRWQHVLLVATLGVSGLFLMLAIFSAFDPRRPDDR